MVRPAAAMRSRKDTSVDAMYESNPEVGSSQNRIDGLVRIYVQVNTFLKSSV